MNDLEHDGSPNCPACAQMQDIGRQLTDLLNASGLDNADRLGVLARITAIGLQASVRPENIDPAVVAYASDLRGLIDHVAQVRAQLGELGELAPPAQERGAQERGAQDEIDRMAEKMLRASLARPSKLTH